MRKILGFFLNQKLDNDTCIRNSFLENCNLYSVLVTLAYNILSSVNTTFQNNSK